MFIERYPPFTPPGADCYRRPFFCQPGPFFYFSPSAWESFFKIVFMISRARIATSVNFSPFENAFPLIQNIVGVARYLVNVSHLFRIPSILPLRGLLFSFSTQRFPTESDLFLDRLFSIIKWNLPPLRATDDFSGRANPHSMPVGFKTFFLPLHPPLPLSSLFFSDAAPIQRVETPRDLPQSLPQIPFFECHSIKQNPSWFSLPPFFLILSW